MGSILILDSILPSIIKTVILTIMLIIAFAILIFDVVMANRSIMQFVKRKIKRMVSAIKTRNDYIETDDEMHATIMKHLGGARVDTSIKAKPIERPDIIGVNYREYVSKFGQEPPNIEEAETVKPKANRIRFMQQRPFTDVDCDAYYIAERQFETHTMVFLRRTDSGWRAFTRSLEREEWDRGWPVEMTEQDILNYLNGNISKRYYTCYDRKLTDMDLAYVFEDIYGHPLVRQNGERKRSIQLTMHDRVDIIAFYFKEGRWVPCADSPTIWNTLSKIRNVAEYDISYYS